MPIRDFDIRELPQLEDAPAAHGALAPHSQLSGGSVFDIVITVVIITGGK
jgi:hypothetical protein